MGSAISLIVSKTLFIEPGSRWENGYCDSFNGKLRDELLNGEIFQSLKEAGSSSRSGASITTKSGRTRRLDIGRRDRRQLARSSFSNRSPR